MSFETPVTLALQATTGAANTGAVHEGGRPPQPRVFGKGNHDHFRPGRFRDEGLLAHGFLDRGQDQVPSLGDLAAHVHAAGLDGLDDRREPAAEVVARLAQGLQGPGFPGPSASDDGRNRGLGGLGRRRPGGIGAPVAGHHGPDRNVGLPAALLSAGASRPVHAEGRVTELAGVVVSTSEELPIDGDPHPDAVGRVHERDGSIHRGMAAHRPHLGQHAGLHGVLHDHRQLGRFLQRPPQIEVAPAEGRRIAEAPPVAVHEPRDHDPHAQTLADLRVLGQDAIDVLGQLLEEGLGDEVPWGTPAPPGGGGRGGRSRASGFGSR